MVTIAGVEYTVDDVDPALANAMVGLADDTTDDAVGKLYQLTSDAVGAPLDVISKLGMRRINSLLSTLMKAVREETEIVEDDAKTVPGVGVKKSS